MSYIVAYVRFEDDKVGGRVYPVNCLRTDVSGGEDVIVRMHSRDGELKKAKVQEARFLNWNCVNTIECLVSETLQIGNDLQLPPNSPVRFGMVQISDAYASLEEAGWTPRQPRSKMFKCAVSFSSEQRTAGIFFRQNGVDVQILANDGPERPARLSPISFIPSAGSCVRHFLAHSGINLFEHTLQFADAFVQGATDHDEFFVSIGTSVDQVPQHLWKTEQKTGSPHCSDAPRSGARPSASTQHLRGINRVPAASPAARGGELMASTFINLAGDRVAELRGLDPAVEAICELQRAGYVLSFSWMRSTFMQQNGTQNSLDRGRAIPKCTDELNQYLWSYGPMIESQWSKVQLELTEHNGPIRLTDYGCGQGLAGLLLFDRFGQSLFGNVFDIVLVEPSDVALIRAESVYRAIAPRASICCINKAFEELERRDLHRDKAIDGIHLFSNVLDVEGFDQFSLFAKTMSEGDHRYVAVSHDREVAGGSQRISALKERFDDEDVKKSLLVKTNEIAKFRCSNPRRSAAISWVLRIEVPRD